MTPIANPARRRQSGMPPRRHIRLATLRYSARRRYEDAVSCKENWHDESCKGFRGQSQDMTALCLSARRPPRFGCSPRSWFCGRANFRRPDERNYAGKESCALFRRNPLVSVCNLTPSCSHEYRHASTYPNGQNSLNETRAVPADPSAYHLSVNTPCPDLARIRSVRAQNVRGIRVIAYSLFCNEP